MPGKLAIAIRPTLEATDPSTGPDWTGLIAAACTGTGVHALYQPVVDLQLGRIIGYEGVVHFDGPGVDDNRHREAVGVDNGRHRDALGGEGSGGRAGADEWLAAARRLGREAELQVAALRTVLAARTDLPPGMVLAFAVSPTTLAADAVASVLDEQPDLDGLVIELTERTPVDGWAPLQGTIERLRDRGARLALDHAGAGYAGLSHILDLRPSILKLDGALVRGVDRDEAKRALVGLLVRTAGRLGAGLVAAGIETAAEVATLRRLGVPMGQGPALGPAAGPWTGLDAEAARIVTTPKASAGTGCTPLVEEARIVGLDECPPAGDYTVVVDELGRPIAAWRPQSARGGTTSPVLIVPATTAITDLARRALARAPVHRFDPVVCTDPAGRPLGIVRIERILDALARGPRAA
jgi:EAL domain-containing protein (putative c-di-GMP-specific phosphodiesterase class I)